MTSLPSDAELTKLATLGYKDAEIAAMYEVTAQAVSKRFVSMGRPNPTPSMRVSAVVDAAYPNRVTQPGKQDYILKAVRNTGRQMLGENLSDSGKVLVDRFLRRLVREGLVVFHSAGETGWILLSRMAADRDFLLRPAVEIRDAGVLADLHRLRIPASYLSNT